MDFLSHCDIGVSAEAAGVWEGAGTGVWGSGTSLKENTPLQRDAVRRGAGGGEAGVGTGGCPGLLGALSASTAPPGPSPPDAELELCSGMLWVLSNQTEAKEAEQ